MNIDQVGFNESWNALFHQHADATLRPVRILAEHKSQYIVAAPDGEIPAQPSGRMRRLMEEDAAWIPAVGDYAAAFIPETGDRAVLEGLLPRSSCFVRLNGFTGEAQALAANIDTVLICASLNKDFNIARLERYLILARQSGARMAIALTKADLSDDPVTPAEITRAIAGDVPVHVLSAVTGQGIDELAPYFVKGETVAAIGSSGVGKSTLVNALFGQEIMKTAAIREDDARGRHTTVHRQIVLLPSGALYLDTPGLREVGLFDSSEGLADVFAEMEALAENCRFRDCKHQQEPGCAVRAALEDGALSQERYKRYIKLLKENAYTDGRAAYLRNRSQFHKTLSRQNRQRK